MRSQSIFQKLITFAFYGKREEEVRLIKEVSEILLFQSETGQGRIGLGIEKYLFKQIKSDFFVDKNIVFLRPQGRAIFIGDTHGDFDATISILKQTKFIDQVLLNKKIVLIFLGDYVDRGDQVKENLRAVLFLKRKFPENVFLLRGNHEEAQTNATYGMLYLFRDDTELYKKYNQLFRFLPSVLVCPNGLVAVHGGIPDEEIKNITDLNNEVLLHQMRWNDPTEEIPERRISFRGATEFGKRAFDRFMKTIGAKVMIRSHQYPTKGFEILFGGRLLTIFSTGGAGAKHSGYKNLIEKARFAILDLEKPLAKFDRKMIRSVDY